MSLDVKNLVFDQLQSRFQRLLPYQDHVRVLVHQYESLAYKFNRVSVKEVLKNIRMRYTQAEWHELKYLFRATFVFILRAASPNLQLSSTEELVKKYPTLANEKMSTLIFLLEFWNLLTITLLIFDPTENAKDMMFFLERMCSPFQSSWNTTIHQRVLLFEGETKVSLSSQCSDDEFQRPSAPHNNSTFHPSEVYLQMQRQQQLVQEVQNREQQLQRFGKLYPQQHPTHDSQQHQQGQYQPHFQNHIQGQNAQPRQQFQDRRSNFPITNPQLISIVQQQRQELELQLFQRRQQSLQQHYHHLPMNHGANTSTYSNATVNDTNNNTSNQGSNHSNDLVPNISTAHGYNSSNTGGNLHDHTINHCNNNYHNNSAPINNRKRSLSNPAQAETHSKRAQSMQPSKSDFWQQRITLMRHNADIPYRLSMLPPAHPVYTHPTHDISVTPIGTLLPSSNNTTLRDVIKDVFREYYAKKQKKFDV